MFGFFGYCIGVRHFMREARLLALAYRVDLPDTVDFDMSALLCELSNEKRTAS